jgi:hypothetical protein
LGDSVRPSEHEARVGRQPIEPTDLGR